MAFSALPAEAAAGALAARPGTAARQSLDVQLGLLPYALACFAVALPIFVWICSYASDRAWMTASFAVFAINWAAFYGVIDWGKRNPAARNDTALRGRVHVLGGLLWAGAITQITALGLNAGVAREPILMTAVAGAA